MESGLTAAGPEDRQTVQTHGKHYLEKELYALVTRDLLMFEFLQEAALDGIWYWDLDNPDNEWMSPKFWRLFGYEPYEKSHHASEWQDMIFPEDLAIAKRNLSLHLQNPSKFPYDQTVRYRHKDGSVVWVRCRGLVIHDASGKAVRLLGAHTDLTDVMLKQQKIVSLQCRYRELERQHDEVNHARQRCEFERDQLQVQVKRAPAADDCGFGNEALWKIQFSVLASVARLNRLSLPSLRIDITNSRDILTLCGEQAHIEIKQALIATLQPLTGHAAWFDVDKSAKICVFACEEIRLDEILEAAMQSIHKRAWLTARPQVNFSYKLLDPEDYFEADGSLKADSLSMVL